MNTHRNDVCRTDGPGHNFNAYAKFTIIEEVIYICFVTPTQKMYVMNLPRVSFSTQNIF